MSDEIQRRKSPGIDFGIGAMAAIGAGLFTNPIDVIKVRLQLQGELEAYGTYTRIYKNTFHAAYMIMKHEGLAGIQSGICSALAFQVVLNGIRLGSFKMAKDYELTVNADGQTNILKTVLVTGLAGTTGAVLGSPFYLVKTQVQSQSASSLTAVGVQHGHAGELAAFRSLWREAGIAGLYRQWYANVPRIFFGSATQLTSFSLIEDSLRPFSIFDGKPLLLTFCSAALGGSFTALTMQPLDVISTRLYNQGTAANGTGLMYRNINDAVIKIFKTEGIIGLYKGIGPMWMRIAPHTVLCLCFYEQLEKLYYKISN